MDLGDAVDALSQLLRDVVSPGGQVPHVRVDLQPRATVPFRQRQVLGDGVQKERVHDLVCQEGTRLLRPRATFARVSSKRVQEPSVDGS